MIGAGGNISLSLLDTVILDNSTLACVVGETVGMRCSLIEDDVERECG